MNLPRPYPIVAGTDVDPRPPPAPILAAGGGGPHDPGMDTRVTTLETEMKDVKSTLQRMDVSLAGLNATLVGLATKADVAALGGKVDALGPRMDKVERAIDDTVKSAVGKAIGPVQMPMVLAACGAVVVGLVTALAWVAHQPWFGR